MQSPMTINKSSRPSLFAGNDEPTESQEYKVESSYNSRKVDL
jgi:hypothetical protein